MPDAALSVVILAGGRGRRLGQDKATLPFGAGTLLQYVVDHLSALTDDVIAVLRRDQALTVRGARLVPDRRPEGGALVGIGTGLRAARYAWSLVVACDMPFVELPLVRYMRAQTRGHDIVVPHVEAGYEPLHALYHRRCAAAVWQALDSDQHRLISFHAGLRVREIGQAELDAHDPLGRSFYNINTPDDLRQASEWLRTKG